MPDSLICNGYCEEHQGEVRVYHVSYKGFDWGFFNYCEAAVRDDKACGHTVITKEEYEAAMLAAAEEERK